MIPVPSGIFFRLGSAGVGLQPLILSKPPSPENFNANGTLDSSTADILGRRPQSAAQHRITREEHACRDLGTNDSAPDTDSKLSKQLWSHGANSR